MTLNQPKTYAIVEKETGKVIIYGGIEQYYRTKATILAVFSKIKKEFRGIQIEIKKGLNEPPFPVENDKTN